MLWKALRLLADEANIIDKARAAAPELAQLAALENTAGTASKLKSYTPAETLLADEGTLLAEIWAEETLSAKTGGTVHFYHFQHAYEAKD